MKTLARLLPPPAFVLALPTFMLAVPLCTAETPVTNASHQLVSTVDGGGNLEGCGVRVSGAGSTLTVTLHRERAERTEGELEVMLETPASPPTDAIMTLTTSGAGTIDNFIVDPRDGVGGLHASAEIDGDSAALMMRDLLLAGATVEIAAVGGEAPTSYRFDGPAPPDVVRGYLQCAGNMAR